MNDIDSLHQAQMLLRDWETESTQPEAGRLDITLPAEHIVAAVTELVGMGGWHLAAITGLDYPQTEHEDGQTEILYHFVQRAAILTLRIRVTYGNPIVSSICSVIPAATLYERELIEMFGVIVEGTPSKDKLLLPDDWPDGVYPLRKSFQGLE